MKITLKSAIAFNENYPEIFRSLKALLFKTSNISELRNTSDAHTYEYNKEQIKKENQKLNVKSRRLMAMREKTWECNFVNGFSSSQRNLKCFNAKYLSDVLEILLKFLEKQVQFAFKLLKSGKLMEM